MSIVTKKIEVVVEKESHEMGEFVKKLLVQTAESKLNDGEFTADEIMAIGMTAVTSAKVAVDGITNVADAEGVEFLDVAMGITIPTTEAVKEIVLMKKKFDSEAEVAV